MFNSKKQTNAIVLSAGKGTRMKSDLPKVLHHLNGKPMVLHIIEKLKSIGIENIVVVIGHKSELVKEAIGGEVNYAMQEVQKGTGHAVMQAVDFLNEKGNTLVITGDTPLIEENTILSLLSKHIDSGSKGTVLTAEFDEPFGYGRIIRNLLGDVSRIVEEKDASEIEKEIKEVNTGIFCFDNESLKKGLPFLSNKNAQNEYYLTDILEILNNNGEKVSSYLVKNNEEVLGINDREQLAKAENILKKKQQVEGFTFVD